MARRDGRPLTVASSDERANALDEGQYAVTEGPCLHSLATGIAVLISDIDQESDGRIMCRVPVRQVCAAR